MFSRRSLLKASLLGGVTLARTPLSAEQVATADDRGPDYRIARDVPTRMYDGKKCWCHPRAGIVVGAGEDGGPRVVMTMNTLDVAGSDVFRAVHGLHTDDSGKSWTKPRANSGAGSATGVD